MVGGIEWSELLRLLLPGTRKYSTSDKGGKQNHRNDHQKAEHQGRQRRSVMIDGKI